MIKPSFDSKKEEVTHEIKVLLPQFYSPGRHNGLQKHGLTIDSK